MGVASQEAPLTNYSECLGHHSLLMQTFRKAESLLSQIYCQHMFFAKSTRLSTVRLSIPFTTPSLDSLSTKYTIHFISDDVYVGRSWLSKVLFLSTLTVRPHSCRSPSVKIYIVGAETVSYRYLHTLDNLTQYKLTD